MTREPRPPPRALTLHDKPAASPAREPTLPMGAR